MGCKRKALRPEITFNDRLGIFKQVCEGGCEMKLLLHKGKKRKISAVLILSVFLLLAVSACTKADSGISSTESAAEQSDVGAVQETLTEQEPEESLPTSTAQTAESVELPSAAAGEKAAEKSIYTDANGDTAYIPAEFMVSANEDEQTINTGLVVIGPDGSEFVWIPTTVTSLEVREFGSYFSGGSISDYHDEIGLESYQEMVASVEKYGGFYIGRYEASKGDNGLPASKRVTEDERGQIWVQFSPQDTTVACQNLYADNDTVQGFFPWGINWDTTLQWLVDSGGKLISDIKADSTSWGNYSNDSFSDGARGNYTGAWEEAKANNLYDLAGNNWEWTQERCGSNYVMRGGGYNLMGGACPGNRYPAALRDPLPGNDHHPNVTFRVALYVK